MQDSYMLKGVDFCSSTFEAFANFKNSYIFNGNFIGVKSEYSMSFYKAILDYCHFCSADIHKARFCEITSLNELSFDKANFKHLEIGDSTIFGEVDFSSTTIDYFEFYGVIVKGDTLFYGIDFKGDLLILGSEFSSEIRFTDINFSKNISFTRNKIKNKIIFQECKFDNIVELNECNINSLILDRCNDSKKLELNLVLTKLENFECSNSQLVSSNDPNTFRQLKQLEISKNNHFDALEYYKKEMITRKENIDFKTNKIDKFILTFENIASEFGTNPFKPIFIILCISFIFGLFFSACTGHWEYYVNSSILLINPTMTIEKVALSLGIIKSDILYLSILEPINFLKNIIFGILIYETIKSFRKFSRKL